MDLAWQMNESLSLLASIGDLESIDELGRKQRNAVNGLNYKFFSKYSIKEGDLSGLSLGLGYVFINDRSGDGGNSFDLPSYDTVDVFAAYKRDNWKVQLNIQNATDEVYVQTSVNSRRLFAGEPFNASLSYSYFF